MKCPDCGAELKDFHYARPRGGDAINSRDLVADMALRCVACGTMWPPSRILDLSEWRPGQPVTKEMASRAAYKLWTNTEYPPELKRLWKMVTLYIETT